MEFIKLMEKEYRQTYKRLVWYYPYTVFFRSRFALLLALFSGLVTLFLGYFVSRESLLVLFKFGFLSALFSVFISIFFYFILALTASRRWSTYHKRFIQAGKHLSDTEIESLMNEGKNQKKMKMYLDKKQTILGAILYTTEHFLCIPGIMLISRNELYKVSIQQIRFRTWIIVLFVILLITVPYIALFVFAYFYAKDIFLKESSEKDIVINTIHFTLYNGVLIKLPLNHFCKNPIESTRHIMAWYWKCDPNDPQLSKRIRNATIFMRRQY